MLVEITFILLLLILTLIVILVTAFCGKFLCKLLGWHKPDPESDSRDKQGRLYFYCKYCGKKITLDSQGNWFEI